MTEAGLFKPLLLYCTRFGRGKSLAWHAKVVHAVERFIHYGGVQPGQSDPVRLLTGIGQALAVGTFDSDMGLG